MSYTKNPNFKSGNVLKAADLQALEQALIDSRNNWDIQDENSDGFIANRPIYKDYSGSAEWNGGGTPKVSFTLKWDNTPYQCIPIEQRVKITNAQWISGGYITVLKNDGTEMIKMVGPYCQTSGECLAAKLKRYTNKYTNKKEFYDIILAAGPIYNLPTSVTVGLWVDGVSISKWKPLFFIVTDASGLAPLPDIDASELDIGLYVPVTTDNRLTQRFKALTYMDISIHEDYKNFFNSFRNPIHIVEATSFNDLENIYTLFQPGDIVLTVMPTSTEV